MVWYHPAIGKVHVFLELDSDHLWIDLNNNPFQPIANPFATSFVVTIYLNPITDVKCLFQVRRRCKV
jgi:hypothetical protein